jgi:hypothetical protein
MGSSLDFLNRPCTIPFFLTHPGHEDAANYSIVPSADKLKGAIPRMAILANQIPK